MELWSSISPSVVTITHGFSRGCANVVVKKIKLKNRMRILFTEFNLGRFGYQTFLCLLKEARYNIHHGLFVSNVLAIPYIKFEK